MPSGGRDCLERPPSLALGEGGDGIFTVVRIVSGPTHG
jgi:hypothetical protein